MTNTTHPPQPPVDAALAAQSVPAPAQEATWTQEQIDAIRADAAQLFAKGRRLPAAGSDSEKDDLARELREHAKRLVSAELAHLLLGAAETIEQQAKRLAEVSEVGQISYYRAEMAAGKLKRAEERLAEVIAAADAMRAKYVGLIRQMFVAAELPDSVQAYDTIRGR